MRLPPAYRRSSLLPPGSTTARRQEPVPPSRFEITVHRWLPEVTELAGEWRELLAETKVGNPFLAPSWQLAWARAFVAPGALHVVALRHDGKLVGVAPFYHQRLGWRGRTLCDRLRLVGDGPTRLLTELPQMLILPSLSRRGARAIVNHVVANASADFIDLTLAPEQGWLEPSWLSPDQVSRTAAVGVQSFASATVVMSLPTDPDRLQVELKRNVRESVRRARNRLSRAHLSWATEVVDSPGKALEQAVQQLIALHRRRAAARDRLQHTDYFAEPSAARFLLDAAQGMAADGHLQVRTLRVSGAAVASVVVLNTNGRIYFSVSGMDPEWWEFSPMTLLKFECLREAIRGGAHSANFSSGPNTQKLRWGETLEIYHQFTVIPPSRRGRLLFGLYGPWRTWRDFTTRGSFDPD